MCKGHPKSLCSSPPPSDSNFVIFTDASGKAQLTPYIGCASIRVTQQANGLHVEHHTGATIFGRAPMENCASWRPAVSLLMASTSEGPVVGLCIHHLHDQHPGPSFPSIAWWAEGAYREALLHPKPPERLCMFSRPFTDLEGGQSGSQSSTNTVHLTNFTKCLCIGVSSRVATPSKRKKLRAKLCSPGAGFGWFPGPRSLKARAQYKSNNHLTGGTDGQEYTAHCEEERQ